MDRPLEGEDTINVDVNPLTDMNQQEGPVDLDSWTSQRIMESNLDQQQDLLTRSGKGRMLRGAGWRDLMPHENLTFSLMAQP
ncbi:hypothetical protein SUGI_0199590 [Cryptomeria japonica]|nr:hypothetical protein SUGI_0199590 [Cryptomeria japonica]